MHRYLVTVAWAERRKKKYYDCAAKELQASLTMSTAHDASHWCKKCQGHDGTCVAQHKLIQSKHSLHAQRKPTSILLFLNALFPFSSFSLSAHDFLSSVYILAAWRRHDENQADQTWPGPDVYEAWQHNNMKICPLAMSSRNASGSMDLDSRTQNRRDFTLFGLPLNADLLMIAKRSCTTS